MAKDKLIYASAARKAILDADQRLAYCIDEIPGVDAVKVVHGRWEWYDFEECGLYRCSCCDGAMAYPTHYCPNCGAKMDGDDECD